MSLKQTTPTKVKLGENKFFIRPFPALKAANMTGELASTLAPLLGVLAPIVADKASSGKSKAGMLDVDINANDFAVMLSSCTSLDGDKIESLALKLLAQGNISIEYRDEDGKTETDILSEDLINEIFCGNIEDMFVLCFHVLKVNFSGFFEKLATQSGKAEQDEDTYTKKVRPIK